MLALCLESSHACGMGHLYRGLTLLDVLRARGHNPRLLLNDHAASLAVARARGYEPVVVDVADLATDWETPLIRQHGIRLWVNDRLETDIAHAARVAATGAILVTLDDTGSGAALAALHIVALNVVGDKPNGKCVVRGVDYLILNPEIAAYQRVRTSARSLLVTLGGSDTYGVTVKVVQHLASIGRAATIVIGPAFEHRQALEAVMTTAMILKCNVSSMIEEMAWHDLAITGGGMTAFEANAAGLPCIVIANEAFEVANANLLERLGGAIFAGHHAVADLTLLACEFPLEAMSRAGIANIPLSGAQKVADALEALL